MDSAAGTGGVATGAVARDDPPGAAPRRLPWPRGHQRAAASDGEAFDRRLLAPMVLGSILNPVNSTMIAVTLVPIGVAFGAGPDRTAWLVSALYLATAVGQPVVGRLVDMFGPRRLYLASTSMVGIAGVAGLLAPSLWVLVAARVLLGLGTCAGYPAAMYLIRSEARRTGHDSPASVLTVLSVANQTIAVLGPTLGGLLVDLAGWRAIFSVNIPLSVACLALGAARLPRHAAATDGAGGARQARIDLPGMALFAGMLTALLLFLMHPRVAWLPALAAVAVLGALLAWRESRAGEPFLDLRVLAGNPALLVTFFRTMLTATVSYTFIYGFTQWLEAVRGLSASAAGLVLLPIFASGIVVAAVSGRREAVRAKLAVSAVAQLAGAALVLAVSGASPVVLFLLIALVLGIPQGLTSLALQNAVYRQADAARLASSAGLMRTFMYLGAITAGAATSGFLGQRATTGGLHALTLFLLGAALLFLLITLPDRSLARPVPGAAPEG